MDDLHGPAAQHVRRPNHHRVADARGDGAGLFEAVGRTPGGRPQVELLQEIAKTLAVLGAIDGVGAGPEQLHAGVLQRHRQA